MKLYAVVTDVTPSEQLIGNDNDIKVIGIVVGLHHKNSFDEVGDKYPDPDKRYRLRKWSNSSQKYKRGAIDHARFLQSTGNVVFGVNIASERVIRETGATVFQQLEGPFPTPVSHNKKGRPKMAMGGYKVDGKPVPRFDVLKDELLVLGWYTETLVAFHNELLEINGKDVKLDVIVDRLPLEQGGNDYCKATLFKKLLSKASRSLVNLAGIPEIPDGEPRDLLVDNIAGMGRELALRPKSDLSGLIANGSPIIRFTRINL